jgi:hypothetical protein
MGYSGDMKLKKMKNQRMGDNNEKASVSNHHH